MVELGLHRVAVVVEDDADIRNLLEAVLTQAGFETFTASDGLEGVDAVRRHNPVVTTLDISLPGIDGFEVARRIRTFSSTYIVMLTARDEEIDTLVGLDAGADDYLTKPFRPRELRARVEAMLRRPRMPGAGDTPVGGPGGPSAQAAMLAAQGAGQGGSPEGHPVADPAVASYTGAPLGAPFTPLSNSPMTQPVGAPGASAGAEDRGAGSFEAPGGKASRGASGAGGAGDTMAAATGGVEGAGAGLAGGGGSGARNAASDGSDRRGPTGAVATPPEIGLDEWLEHGSLRLSPDMRLVECDGQSVELTRSEFELLLCIMENGRRVVSKQTLALAMRGDDYDTGEYVSDSDRRTVEVHLANLRRKLGDDTSKPRWIETVRGVGYRLAAPQAQTIPQPQPQQTPLTPQPQE